MRFHNGITAIAVISSLACSDRSSKVRELGSQQPSVKSEVSAAPSRSASEVDGCVPSNRTQVSLSGVIREEHKLGPPGYGETPKQDHQVAILVLRLPTAIDVCADTTVNDPRPATHGVQELQLTGHLDPSQIKPYLGQEISVYGNLYRKAWGTDYTEVLIRVDSIPGIYHGSGRKAVEYP